ncbi:MAG: UbiA family prenyltransferase [Halobacteriota archaeon]
MNVSVPEVLFGQAAPVERTFRNEIIGFISMQRLAIDVMSLPPVAAFFALAGGQVDARLFFFLLVAVLVAIATNIINDLADVERDKTKWPLRPLPTGLLSKRLAATYVLITAGIALVIAGMVFNSLFLVLALLELVLAAVYAGYTRDNIGHLTAAIPIALLPVVAWSAASPETILTPLPWLLALFCVPMSVTAQLFNEASVPGPTLFVKFKPSTDKLLCVASAAMIFIVGTAIFLYAQLAWPFMAVLAAYAIWTLAQARNFGMPESAEKLQNALKVRSLWLIVLFLTVAVLIWVA